MTSVTRLMRTAGTLVTIAGVLGASAALFIQPLAAVASTGTVSVVSATTPTITFTGGPTNGSTISTPTVTVPFTGKNTTDFICMFGSTGNPYPCNSPQTFTGLADGFYPLTILGTNAATHEMGFSSESFIVNTKIALTTQTNSNPGTAGVVLSGTSTVTHMSNNGTNGTVTGFQTGYSYHKALATGTATSGSMHSMVASSTALMNTASDTASSTLDQTAATGNSKTRSGVVIASAFIILLLLIIGGIWYARSVASA